MKKNDSKLEKVSFRLSLKQKNKLKYLAKFYGYKQSEFVREAVFNYNPRRRNGKVGGHTK
jgi:predicted DNA-binding protein